MKHDMVAAASGLALSCGEGHCELLPGLGGSLGGWTLRGQRLLRPASETALRRFGAFATGGFPLVPYSNRIAGGRFSWGGKEFSLARNFWPEPHAIHGAGFERPWTVDELGECSAVLSLRYPGGAAWPFPFRAEQRYLLGAHTLVIELSATNLADTPVPLCFGHHPYFPRAGARLQFAAQHVWMSGEDGLPTLRVRPFDRFDFSSGAGLERGDIDHCYTGWDGLAKISWRGQPLGLEMTASPELRCAVVYASGDKEEFCFEPVAHLTDAINRSTDFTMPVVAPGASFQARIELRAVPVTQEAGR